MRREAAGACAAPEALDLGHGRGELGHLALAAAVQVEEGQHLPRSRTRPQLVVPQQASAAGAATGLSLWCRNRPQLVVPQQASACEAATGLSLWCRNRPQLVRAFVCLHTTGVCERRSLTCPSAAATPGCWVQAPGTPAAGGAGRARMESGLTMSRFSSKSTFSSRMSGLSLHS